MARKSMWILYTLPNERDIGYIFMVRTMKRIPMEQDNYCLTNQIAKRMADGEGYILGLCRIVGKQDK